MTSNPVKTVGCRPAGSKHTMSALQTLAQHQQDRNPFYLLDLGRLQRRMSLFQKLLPSVVPHYAVKCLPDPLVIQALAALGAGFDCASQHELALVLGFNVEPSKIVFANACKPSAHIKYAKDNGVSLMTFDNLDELDKIHAHYPKARLLLRLAVDDSHSVCRLGLKYGAAQSSINPLLQHAKELDLNIVGVSFHVGSGCMSSAAYLDAMLRAKDAMRQATDLGFVMTILDIGGGFPGTAMASTVTQGANAVSVSFDEIAGTIKSTLESEFAQKGLTVIAEPGRFFAASIMDLAVNVIARRVLEEEKHVMLYINDGVYGSFNCILYDHAHVQGYPLFPACSVDNDANKDLWSTSVWGPTCDSLDCVSKDACLPLLGEGDWLYYRDMGAYTKAAASGFNGFHPPEIYYTYSVEAGENLEQLLPTDFPMREQWVSSCQLLK
eukprot:m.246243 g.246243  ORF g.246243 m.246243 type:complete len:438 (+) comp17472_c0_seq1:180-1493(+)